MKFSIDQSDLQKIANKFSNLQKQMPDIRKSAINNIAFDVMDSTRKQIQGAFNGKDLSKSILIRKATNERDYAEIYVDDKFRWKQNALNTLGVGQDRARKGLERLLIKAGYMKPYEILIPDGKLSGGQYTKIASQLQLFFKEGFSANETASSRKKNQARSGVHSRFFIVTSNHFAFTNDLGAIKKRKTGLAPGVYVLVYDKVEGTNKGEKVWRRLAAEPIRLLKIAKKPNYKKMYNIEEIFRKVYERRGQKHILDAFQHVFNKVGNK
ncbi:hypothetical protein [Arcobacter aquimarinus]|uniref:hypothetical protein n=1 Tax=Arcobacter aquimarinus TaxID=1315211 RepID=UPI003BB1EBC2